MRISDWSSDVCSSDLLKKAVDIVVPGGRGSDQISLAFKVDLLPGYVRFQCGEVRCVICYPVRVEARERVSRAPKNTERLFNTATIRRPDPRDRKSVV